IFLRHVDDIQVLFPETTFLIRGIIPSFPIGRKDKVNIIPYCIYRISKVLGKRPQVVFLERGPENIKSPHGMMTSGAEIKRLSVRMYKGSIFIIDGINNRPEIQR